MHWQHCIWTHWPRNCSRRCWYLYEYQDPDNIPTDNTILAQPGKTQQHWHNTHPQWNQYRRIYWHLCDQQLISPRPTQYHLLVGGIPNDSNNHRRTQESDPPPYDVNNNTVASYPLQGPWCFKTKETTTRATSSERRSICHKGFAALSDK